MATRRTVLFSAAVVGLATGCSNSESPPPKPDPAMEDMLSASLALRDIADTLEREDISADHSAHAETLQRLLGDVDVEPLELEVTDIASLATTESEHAEAAQEAALTADRGYAVLLAEIAACRSAHVETLQNHD